MGALGGRVDHPHDRREAGDPAEHRWFAAERMFRGHAGFADDLGAAFICRCSQHAPDEHVLAPIVREGLQMMTGLFWDLAENGVPARR